MRLKSILKPVAVIGAAAMLVSASGCADTSWSLKTQKKTLTNGGWIYYTYDAANEAISKINEDSEQEFDITKDDLSSKKIEGKAAYDWIYDTAKKNALHFLTVDKLCRDNKLDEDKNAKKNIVKTYQGYFDAGYMDIYKDLGIGAETFAELLGYSSEREKQLFDYLYGSEGPKAVKDDELTKYFKEKYTTYYYIPYSLKTTDENQNEVDIDDETHDKVISSFAKYAKDLNEGKTTDEIDDAYKTDFSVETSAGVKQTAILEDSGLPEELQKAIKELDDKKAAVKTIDNTHYLIYKGSIDDEAKTLPEEADEVGDISKHQIRHEMKDDDFKSYIDEEQKKLKYEVNDACLSKYSVSRTVDIMKSNAQKTASENAAAD